MAVQLFDFIDSLFNLKKYQINTAVDKRQSFFMTERMMSIHYPLQVEQLNVLDINKERIMDFWSRYLSGSYSRKPGWIFTKVNPSSKKENKKDNFSKIKQPTIDYFLSKNMLDERDYNTLKRDYPEELLEELEIIQKNL